MRNGFGRGWLAVVMVGLLAVVLGGERAVAQPCEAEWAEGIFPAEGVGGRISAFTVFDDGTGPALYAGGDFATAGGEAANNVARWDGSTWSPLGEGIDGWVEALAVFDDGSGPALFAGGRFFETGGERVGYIAKWDGTAWRTLTGGGLNGPGVKALAVFDDGSGPALYAGGLFERTVSGVTVNYVAKWDGSAWSDLAGGVSGPTGTRVQSLHVFDDGTGPALYAGGYFYNAGGVAAQSIARWDGSAWTALADGVDGGSVHAMTQFDDGTGPALYAGGNFFGASGATVNHVARWDGAAWTPLGDGMDPRRSSVDALAVYDDGTGPALYAGGEFDSAGGVLVNNIARWDGAAWAAMDGGVSHPSEGYVWALATFDGGSGETLLVGGNFLAAGGQFVSHLVGWDGMAWRPQGDAVNERIAALTTFDDGAGPALYAGGEFTVAGGVEAERIARWDGANWTPLGEGVGGTEYYAPVQALAAYDDGTGPALYAAGDFNVAGGVEAHNIARWDGSVWTPLGEGLTHTFSLEVVFALAVFDDGTGPALYAGGQFNTAGGTPASGIARWDGSAWTPVGSGLDGWARSMVVFDDGTGPALYVGGGFESAGGVAASGIARWDGSAWTPLGEGVRDPWGSGDVHALTVFDDGAGPALYAGGNFVTAGDIQALRIARWDGSSWSPLGRGVWYALQVVNALAVFDDGTGPSLFAGGSFQSADGVEASSIARWDGSAWTPLGSGILYGSGSNGWVDSLAVFDGGGGPALLVGGDFIGAGGVGSGYLARWGCAPAPCRADIDGDGQLTIFDFLGYQNLFDAGDLAADFDGDGALTIFDFLAFQNEFDAGCD